MGIAKKIRKSLNAEAIDTNRKRFEQEFKEVNNFLVSEEFKEFEKLNNLIKSSNFIKNKKEIESLSYKKSKLRQDEKMYKKLSSKSKIKTYFKILDTSEYRNFIKHRLEKNSETVLEFEKCKDFKIIKEMENSQILKDYTDYKIKIESNEFIKEKEYLLNKDRYKTTADYDLLKKYESYMVQSAVKNYLKHKDSSALDTISNWKLVFEDSFSSNKLDSSKWTCIANNIPSLLNSNFSQVEDKHFFTAGENISIKNNILEILTKKEKTEGILLDNRAGFRKTSFDYSSGIITTQGIFSQKYGKFEAKIKFGDMSVNHSFWLAGDKKTPHVDVIKAIEKKKSLCSLIMSEQNISCEDIKKIDLSKEYFIYTLIWTSDKMEWRINDIPVWSQTKDIPSEPMSLFFASPVYKDLSSTTKMSIDWVRIYEKA